MKTKSVAKLLPHDGGFESETHRLRAAQIWQLYSQSRVGLIGALLGALILVATLWNVVSHLVLVVWLVSYALVQVARHALISAFHRTSPSGEATFRWGAWFAVGTFLSALLWGLAGVFLYPANSPLHQFVLSIFLAGITSAAAVVYSPITECYLPTILVGMLPLAARHIYDWDEAHLITGGVIVLFSIVLALTASRMHGFVVGSLRLRFEKDKLVESLQEARGDLEMRVEERSAELKRTNENLVAEIAERVSAEKALRESEEKYRSLAELLPQFVYEVDEKGFFTFVNRSALEATGYTQEDVDKGLNALDVFIPEETERLADNISRSLGGEKIPGTDYTLLRKDGATMSILVYARPIVHDEKIVGLRGVGIDISDRKLAEEALRESEEKYRRIVENTQDVIYQTDMDGRLIFASPSSERLLGYTPEEVLGRRLSKLYALPEERTRLLKLLMENGSVTDFEAELTRKDGSRVWISTNARLLRDENGNPIGAEGVGRDVTGRKKAEKDLHESREMLQIVLDTIPAGVFWKDRDSVYLGANRAWLEAAGLNSSQEVMGKTDYDLPWVKDEANSYRNHDRMVMESGIPEYDIIETYTRADGSLAWAKTNKVPLRDPEGNVVGILGTYEDITERKRGEQALRESEERFKQVAANAGEWIWEVDAAGVYRYCSSAAEKILGYTPDELVGHKHFYDLFAPEVRQNLKEVALAAFGRKEPFRNFVNPNIHKNGEICILETSGSPMLDDQGALLGYRGTDTDITERRKAEDAMRQQRDFLQQLIDTIPTPIFYKDVGGRYMGCNRAFESDTGMSRTDIVGKTVFQVGPPNLAQIYHEQDLSLLRNPGVQQGEASRQDAAGNRHEVMFTKATFSDLEGNIVGLVGVILDITERKQAEQALKASETRYRRLFEAAKDGILILDADTGQIVDVNPFLAELLGYSREDMLEKKLWEIGLFADITKSQTAFTELQSEEYARYEDLTIQTQAGKVVNVEFVSNVYVVNGSKVIQCNIRDITDRKRADEALRESEQEYQRLFEDALDGICITKTDGTLVEANQAFLCLFGYRSREELIGRSLLALYIDPQDWTRLRQVIDPQGFVKDYSTRLQKKDGTEIDGHVTLRVRLNTEGTIIGYRGMVRDVTEQNKLERELLQAQKMEAIGTLAGGIAHDFNNLLTVVQGFSELLLAEKDQKHPEYEDLQKIFHAANNGAELVKQLLMFSRKSEPKLIPMSLNKQIVQVEKLLRRTIPKMIDINLDLSADLPKINADPSQIEQVLMNLAVNARDAMPDKGNLTVKTEALTLDEEYCRSHIEASPGDYVLLEVLDTGQGMDKETVEHIFEPFFTTKEVGRGTGLGLAMVYGIVKQHDGHVTVYSEVGKGTAFKVYLPAIQGEVETKVEAPGLMPILGTETVLLVDDEQFVRELGARILTKHGYTVLQAENGRQALDLFKKERSQISLVILDLIMPEMSGTECLKELLNIDPQVNVLIASGFSAEKSVKDTIQMGAKRFATKPFRVKGLLQDVRRVLDED